ncbi:MAG TPA: DUF3108 domain-containing protein [Acidobacteriota bacterium]|nr:DUF3108 domain-containing protein [Acidobacteriota bacterium]
MALRIKQIITGSLPMVLLLAVLAVADGDANVPPLVKPGEEYTAPFGENERLLYEVNWKPLFLLPAFKAGEIDFRTFETTFENRPVFKVTAEARSNGRLASIAGIDVKDYFESIFDRHTFRPYRYVKKIREGKRKRDVQLIFDYPHDRLLLTENDVAVTPPKEVKNRTIEEINEPLADVVSVFYIGRLRPFETGQKFFVHLIDQGDAKRVSFHIAKKENVDTPIGRFRAVRINTNGQIFSSGGNFRVWYSTDPLRVPVRFEADVAFGKVYGTLIAIDTGSTSRGLVKSR